MKTFITDIMKGREGSERGVALLFVVLLTSVLMLVAIGITNISYREAAFSVQAKDSDKAFFASDTGIECGLYLDGKGLFGGGGTAPADCAGVSLALADLTGAGDYVFALPLGSSCAEISVDKNYTASDGSGPYTQITSIGYNVAGNPDSLPSACVTETPDPKVVTRALRTRYLNDGTDSSGGGDTTHILEDGDGGFGGFTAGTSVTTDPATYDGETWYLNASFTVGTATIVSEGIQYGLTPGSYDGGVGTSYASTSMTHADPYAPCPHGTVYYQAVMQTTAGTLYGDEQSFDCSEGGGAEGLIGNNGGGNDGSSIDGNSLTTKAAATDSASPDSTSVNNASTSLQSTSVTQKVAALPVVQTDKYTLKGKNYVAGGEVTDDAGQTIVSDGLDFGAPKVYGKSIGPSAYTGKPFTFLVPFDTCAVPSQHYRAWIITKDGTKVYGPDIDTGFAC